MVEWEQKPSWVAVFDILGFKSLIQDAERSFPRSLLTNRLSELVELLEGEIGARARIEYLVFSDTFVLLAPDLEIQHYPWFLLICTHLIERSIQVELPLRGAISAGSVFISRQPQMLLGSAFLEAYEYQEDQDWVGLVLTPSASGLARSHGLEPRHHDFVSDDAVPMRKLKSADVLAYRFQNGAASFRSPLIRHLEQMRHFAPEVAKGKFQRTIEFIDRHYRYTSR